MEESLRVSKLQSVASCCIGNLTNADKLKAPMECIRLLRCGALHGEKSQNQWICRTFKPHGHRKSICSTAKKQQNWKLKPFPRETPKSTASTNQHQRKIARQGRLVRAGRINYLSHFFWIHFVPSGHRIPSLSHLPMVSCAPLMRFRSTTSRPTSSTTSSSASFEANLTFNVQS